jgi:hypothetical protein
MDDSIQAENDREMNTVMADNARLTEEVCSLSEKRTAVLKRYLIGEVYKIEKPTSGCARKTTSLRKT